MEHTTKMKRNQKITSHNYWNGNHSDYLNKVLQLCVTNLPLASSCLGVVVPAFLPSGVVGLSFLLPEVACRGVVAASSAWEAYRRLVPDRPSLARDRRNVMALHVRQHGRCPDLRHFRVPVLSQFHPVNIYNLIIWIKKSRGRTTPGRPREQSSRQRRPRVRNFFEELMEFLWRVLFWRWKEECV